MEPKLKESRWDKNIEKGLLEKWEKENVNQFKCSGKILTIDTPPPYPSGRPWHIGAAAHYAQIDMIARTFRLMGRNVLFPLGIDRNGIPVEMYTEKKFGISIHKTPREEFIQKCKEALDELEGEMISIMKAMGMSCDFQNHYRTDSPEYRARTQATFIELWKKGLVYEDTRLNNYCLGCKTTLADNEVGYKDIPTHLNHVDFQIMGGGKITIATTRPELLCIAALIIFNPADKRYKHLEGKKAVVPIFNIEVPIISHPIADPEFGTGLMYMSRSAGDLDAIRFLREMGIKPEVCITLEGLMGKNAGLLEGLPVRKAREKIRDELRNKGFLVKEEKILHRTPVCERSGDEIEYISMPEFYLKQMEFKETLKRYAKEIDFHPELYRQTLMDWINGINMDWPISRRRVYATEIPIWYCKNSHPNLPEPGKYYRPWKDKPPFKTCKCGSNEFKGEERTFDTWMDSSISPLIVTKFFEDNEFFSAVSKEIVRPQAKDIIRTWFYYSLLRCHQLTGKRIFSDGWIMGYGLDEKGEKMSKSKGNVVDPAPVLEKYGADCFRFWAAQEASLGYDFRISEEKIEGNGKFLTKLLNTARFISSFAERRGGPHIEKETTEKGGEDGYSLHVLDKWILDELAALAEECRKGYEDLNFFIPSNKIRNFIWNIFAPHYLEMAKARAYSGDKAALHTLNTCLKSVLVMLSPISPFISDHIYRELYGKTVFREEFPELERSKTPFKGEELIELNSWIWKEKKERNLSLKAEVKELSVPEKFRPIESDLKACHNIQRIKYMPDMKALSPERLNISF